jgi:hypothetical protein
MLSERSPEVRRDASALAAIRVQTVVAYCRVISKN